MKQAKRTLFHNWSKFTVIDTFYTSPTNLFNLWKILSITLQFFTESSHRWERRTLILDLAFLCLKIIRKRRVIVRILFVKFSFCINTWKANWIKSSLFKIKFSNGYLGENICLYPSCKLAFHDFEKMNFIIIVWQWYNYYRR